MLRIENASEGQSSETHSLIVLTWSPRHTCDFVELYRNSIKPLYTPAYLAIPEAIRTSFRVTEVAKRNVTLSDVNDGDVDSCILMACELGSTMLLVHSTVLKSPQNCSPFIAKKRISKGDVVAHFDPSLHCPSWLTSDPQVFSEVPKHANGCILESCKLPTSSNNLLYTSCLGPYLHCGGEQADTPNLILRFHPTIRWKLTGSSLRHFPLVEVVASADIYVGARLVLSHMVLTKVALSNDNTTPAVSNASYTIYNLYAISKIE